MTMAYIPLSSDAARQGNNGGGMNFTRASSMQLDEARKILGIDTATKPSYDLITKVRNNTKKTVCARTLSKK